MGNWDNGDRRCRCSWGWWDELVEIHGDGVGSASAAAHDIQAFFMVVFKGGEASQTPPNSLQSHLLHFPCSGTHIQPLSHPQIISAPHTSPSLLPLLLFVCWRRRWSWWTQCLTIHNFFIISSILHSSFHPSCYVAVGLYIKAGSIHNSIIFVHNILLGRERNRDYLVVLCCFIIIFAVACHCKKVSVWLICINY